MLHGFTRCPISSRLKIDSNEKQTGLFATDFKPVAEVFTSSYYALPNSIYRRFSRQSTLRLAWYEHVSPSSSSHLSRSSCTKQAIRVCRYSLAKEIPIERIRIFVSRSGSSRVDNVRAKTFSLLRSLNYVQAMIRRVTPYRGGASRSHRTDNTVEYFNPPSRKLPDVQE